MARLSVHTEDQPEQGQPVPDYELDEEKAIVYGVVRAASPSPHIQANVSLARLFEKAVEMADALGLAEVKGVANMAASMVVASNCSKELNTLSHFSLDLFEMVRVFAEWSKLAANAGEESESGMIDEPPTWFCG